MIRRYWWLAGLAIAALVVIVLSPLASSDPDGLERAAIDLGFAELGRASGGAALPDYSVPVLGNGPVSLIVAGLIGVLVVFLAMWLIGRLLARRARHSD
jgi:hypothetical protein